MTHVLIDDLLNIVVQFFDQGALFTVVDALYNLLNKDALKIIVPKDIGFFIV